MFSHRIVVNIELEGQNMGKFRSGNRFKAYYAKKVLFSLVSILAYQIILLFVRFQGWNFIFTVINVGLISLIYFLISD